MTSAPTCPPSCAARSTGECDETVTDASFPYGCHVCEVEIDPDTGTWRIVRHTAVDDVGRAVNPLIIHGQTHGGIAQGVGQALLEQCFYDARHGQLCRARSWTTRCRARTCCRRSPTAISEVPSTTHPLGLRPAGEGGTTPALAVVINAIVDALSEFGVEHIEMPVTPERIWRAMYSKPQLSRMKPERVEDKNCGVQSDQRPAPSGCSNSHNDRLRNVRSAQLTRCWNLRIRVRQRRCGRVRQASDVEIPFARVWCKLGLDIAATGPQFPALGNFRELLDAGFYTIPYVDLF